MIRSGDEKYLVDFLGVFDKFAVAIILKIIIICFFAMYHK
jgi:hypothetical protein